MRCGLCLLLLAALATPVRALVDPEPTALPVPPWLVDIVVAGASQRVFCRGALIAPQWVLSTGTCLNDPFHLLDDVAPGKQPEYFARLGPNGDVVEVQSFVHASDYGVGLFKIALPSSAAPLPLTSLTSSELLGKAVVLYGRQATTGFRDAFYNPGGSGPAALCRVEGRAFVGQRSWCYLLGRPRSEAGLFQTRATVLDPAAPGAPATALDRSVTPDRSGRTLYLDFRASASYPCNEDLGLPVLLPRADGGVEIAGVVARVGVAAGLPLCGPSLANEFSSIEAIRAFIAETETREAFTSLCPATPVPTLRWLEAGSRLSLHWPAVPGASGYRVHYTSRHGHEPIETLDLGNRTSLTAPRAAVGALLVAVSAYNERCGSVASRPLSATPLP